ncbi:MAG: hypothetical protein JW982_03085 [Spirochaetes bacterium]|nr:hypothetical protein [Spirochaetota bacterium]
MKKLLITAAAAFLMFSCSSFIPEETQDRLKLKYEVPEYVLITDLEVYNKPVLRKGETVKLLITVKSSKMSDSSIKVYAYKYENENSLLKSERYLLVYMFDTSFEDKPAESPDKKDLEKPVFTFNEEKLDAEIHKYVKEKNKGK